MKACERDGCDRRYFARGLCAAHYMAERRCPVNERRFDFRRRYRSEWPREWDSRTTFLRDVGPMPGPKFRLRKLNADKPLSKDNIGWVAILAVPIQSDDPRYNAALGGFADNVEFMRAAIAYVERS